MDLPRGLQDMIDEYVSSALDTTGTRKSRAHRVELPLPAPRASEPAVVAAPVEPDLEIDVSDMAAEEPSDGILPIEIDETTDPGIAPNMFTFDEGTAWMAPAFVTPVDPIPTLSRIRTARGTPPPPAEIEIDDEITNVLKTPPAPKC